MHLPVQYGSQETLLLFLQRGNWWVLCQKKCQSLWGVLFFKRMLYFVLAIYGIMLCVVIVNRIDRTQVESSGDRNSQTPQQKPTPVTSERRGQNGVWFGDQRSNWTFFSICFHQIERFSVRQNRQKISLVGLKRRSIERRNRSADLRHSRTWSSAPTHWKVGR